LPVTLTTFLYVLILAGSVQGMITGSLLFFTRPYRTANRLLGMVVWLIALPGFHLFGHYALFFQDSLVADLIHALIPWVAVMAVGPLMYLYLRSVTTSNFKIGKKERSHFIPVLIDLFPKLVELLFITGLLRAVLPGREEMTYFIDTYNRFADIPRWLSLAYYVSLSARYLRQWKAAHAERPVANADMIQWLSRFIGAMQVFVIIWLVYLIPYILPATSVALRQKLGWFPVYIPMATLIYWIGIAGYKQALATPVVIKEKNTESGWSSEQLAQTAQTLLTSMEKDRLFLNAELDLTELAKATGMSAKLISATLNQHVNCSFSQFINEYRVAEFKKRILQPDTAELTLAGVAASCGFSSQATFQRIFKQITGVTPTEYKKSAQPVA
jgi:AraC-like DNA-binding protein